ncbi:WD repeat-containing protein WRAP73-like isoform X1 [Branchiostoma floridae]|uniref:WD repeat-containing protein WRAP73-like isoform X1 n=2 Tax=Branchiostoma floridae TaxID=7739 RepID=A0A9J7NB78_BRAFL|nr:WD repeat-containing protein WRAP73-like isoform X1 [Branchiostoma floridae]
MNFSDLFQQTSGLCLFSPNGKYLANCVQYRLIVRDVRTLQILHLYTCLDAVQHIVWSPDSQFILCGMYKRGITQVWSIEQPEWTCKIDEGSAGLESVCWSPDSRHILTFANFQLRITVWSLINKSVSYIKYPKQGKKMLDFTSDGSYMALAERRDCKDYISVFSCKQWQLMKHFETDTKDLAGLEWAPNGRALAVWDSILDYKLLLYSLDGRCLSTYSAYEWALGIKCVSWSPSSQFLAVGSFDEKVRLLNHLTWKVIIDFSHPPLLEGKAVVYKEIEKKLPSLQGEVDPPGGAVFTGSSHYEVVSERPAQIPVIKADPEKANPKIGVSLAVFSPDSKYLATRNDNMPCALWIWDIRQLALVAILLQAAPVKHLEWDPCQSRLAFCTGTNKVYMWSPAGALSVDVPVEASFLVQSLRWHPEGAAVLLMGRENMCMCFIDRDKNR